MKKFYARIVPLVFVLGACSSSDEPAADPSVPVDFSVQTETRAAVTGTYFARRQPFQGVGRVRRQQCFRRQGGDKNSFRMYLHGYGILGAGEDV